MTEQTQGSQLKCPRCESFNLKTLSVNESSYLIPFEELECQECYFIYKQPIYSYGRWMEKHLEEGIKDLP